MTAAGLSVQILNRERWDHGHRESVIAVRVWSEGGAEDGGQCVVVGDVAVDWGALAASGDAWPSVGGGLAGCTCRGGVMASSASIIAACSGCRD